MITDALGQKIKANDYIVWVRGGRYTELAYGVVSKAEKSVMVTRLNKEDREERAVRIGNPSKCMVLNEKTFDIFLMKMITL